MKKCFPDCANQRQVGRGPPVEVAVRTLGLPLRATLHVSTKGVGIDWSPPKGCRALKRTCPSKEDRCVSGQGKRKPGGVGSTGGGRGRTGGPAHRPVTALWERGASPAGPILHSATPSSARLRLPPSLPLRLPTPAHAPGPHRQIRLMR